jgi:hypothetical protein
MSLKAKFSGVFAVKCCLNGFHFGFWRKKAWFFSILSALTFLEEVSPAQRHHNLGYVDGVEYLD